MRRGIVLCVVFIMMLPGSAWSVCRGKLLNPVTEVCWECVLPIKIASVPIIPSSSGIPDYGKSQFPLCTCPAPPPIFVRVGVPLEYWAPTYMVEVIKDPMCFPSLGIKLPNPFLGRGHGDQASKTWSTGEFFHTHMLFNPATAVINSILGAVCAGGAGSPFDVMYLSEVDPLWQDDRLNTLLWAPETLLFANPVAQLACTADSVSAVAGYPIQHLFWCQGAWGPIYPNTGHTFQSGLLNGSAGAVGKVLAKTAKTSLLKDHQKNLCAATSQIIWNKRLYRYQIARPGTGMQCVPIGKTSMIWGIGKNSPSKPDNFLYNVFEKRACCMF